MAVSDDDIFGGFDSLDDYIESLFEEAYGDEFEEWDDLKFWEMWEDFIDAFYEEFNDQYSEQ